MRVLLIEPPEQIPPRELLYPPVLPRGLLITATALGKMGHEARVVDLRCLNKAPQDLPSLCGDFVPNVVGLSIHGAPSVVPAIGCIDVCRCIWPDARIIAGGVIVKAAKAVIRKLVPADIALFDEDTDVRGEDLAALLDGDSRPRVSISIDHGHTPSREGILRIPHINYDALISNSSNPMASYVHEDFEPHLETQRGCPYGCRYCGTFPRGKSGMLYRDPNEAIEEMRELDLSLRKIKDRSYLFWVTDETFTSNMDHAVAFCSALSKQSFQFRWRAQTRADLVNAEILSLMKQGGCEEISFGIESLSDAVLLRVSKGADVHTSVEAMRAARLAGLKVRAIIIIGLPGDSTASVRSTFEILNDFSPDLVQVYAYHPTPGSPEFESQAHQWHVDMGALGLKNSNRGFLDTPPHGTGDLSVKDVCRWFVAANHGFPGAFNPSGDQAQIEKIIHGSTRGLNGRANQIDSISRPHRFAILEFLVASTGEFTRDEILGRAKLTSGLGDDQLESLFSSMDDSSQICPRITDPLDSDVWRPRLHHGMVLVRTSEGGLACCALDDSKAPPDDLLRRTYTLRRDGYEILIRCSGDYTVNDIAHCTRAVIDDPSITRESIEANLHVFQEMGFVE